MKTLFSLAIVSASLISYAQAPKVAQMEGMKAVAFLQGDWHGKQNFNTGGPPMVGENVNQIRDAVGGLYLEEKLATTLPGRKATDSRHFITFDPTSKKYEAWWFNDSSVGAMQLEGDVQGTKLVMETKSTGASGEHIFRATYNATTTTSLEYTLELQGPSGWRLLFTSSYTK